MKILDPLTDSLKGRQLIEASAGTGKTYTITTLFLRLLVEMNIDIGRILVVTFTDAAAAELKERIRSRMADALQAYRTNDLEDPLYAHLFSEEKEIRLGRLVRGLRNFDCAEISTIHGFLKKLLGDHAFECGVPFDSELTTDQTELYEEVVCDFYAKETAAASPLFLTYLESEGHGPEALAELMRHALGRRDATRIPSRAAVPDPSFEFESAFYKAKAAFEDDGDGFELMLDDHKEINRRVYNKRNLPRWFAVLSDYFASERPVVPIPEVVGRFTSDALGLPNSEHPMLAAVDELDAAGRGFERAWLDVKLRFLEEAEAALRAVKDEKNVYTFDDLIYRVDDALAGEMGPLLRDAVRERLAGVLIDEFQDTDPIQYRIFDTLFGQGETPFILIGDPKQSIYGFRGADIFTYLKAASAAGARRTTLSTNWRSDPGLIRAVNTVFSRLPSAFFYDDISFSPVSAREGAADRFPNDKCRAPLEIRFVSRELFGISDPTRCIPKSTIGEQLPDLLAQDINTLLAQNDLSGRPVTPSRVAVLVSTNKQAEQVLEALRERGIKGVLFGASSVFQSEAADALLLLMRAIDDPTNIGKLQTALATRIVGFDAERLDDFDNAPEALAACVEWMVHLRRIWDERGFIVMWRQLLDDSPLRSADASIGASVLGKSDGERMMTNLRHLAELLERRRGETRCGRRALIQWFMSCRRAQVGRTEDAELRLESDEESVRIITVHKSKGLEFDVVYCPYLYDGLATRSSGVHFFHHPKRERRAYLDLGGPEMEIHRRYAEDEEMAEKLRLAYVALTRARHKTVVVHGAFKNMATSALSYLLHRSDDSESISTLKTRVGKASDEALCADLDALVEASGGAISRTAFVPNDKMRATASATDVSFHCRELKGTISPPLMTTSFTGLMDGEATPATHYDIEADSDERDSADAGASTSADSTPRETSGRRESSTLSLLPLDLSVDESLPLADFERGAHAGTLLHTVFEEMDFTAVDPDRKQKVVRDILARYGFDFKWTEPIVEMLDNVCRTRLPDASGLYLREIPSENRCNELGFVFPMAPASIAIHGVYKQMATLLKAYCPLIPEGYEHELAACDRRLHGGFLKGFIDLVFEYRGRYYIVDYKSNYLGDHASDYGKEQIRRAMAEHHYFVQYHLYTVALHRYLKTRIRAYDFNHHFGGVYYLFLRGMTGLAGYADLGVFHDRPSEALVTALSSLFDGATTGGVS